MAYQPYYSIINWENLSSQKTAINRTNSLHAENGINEADNRITQIDANKADKFTNNALAIEKVVTNFYINDQNELVFILADGTTKTIDLTRFVYFAASSATISMSINNRVMTARIVDGSVIMAKLDVTMQSEFRQYMLNAQAARLLLRKPVSR